LRVKLDLFETDLANQRGWINKKLKKEREKEEEIDEKTAIPQSLNKLSAFNL
jgi:hypothetical protein